MSWVQIENRRSPLMAERVRLSIRAHSGGGAGTGKRLVISVGREIARRLGWDKASRARVFAGAGDDYGRLRIEEIVTKESDAFRIIGMDGKRAPGIEIPKPVWITMNEATATEVPYTCDETNKVLFVEIPAGWRRAEPIPASRGVQEDADTQASPSVNAQVQEDRPASSTTTIQEDIAFLKGVGIVITSFGDGSYHRGDSDKFLSEGELRVLARRKRSMKVVG